MSIGLCELNVVVNRCNQKVIHKYFKFYSRHGDFAPRIVDGPVIIITFMSYEAVNNDTSRGFTLYYRGCGPNIPNPPTFSHFYREKILDDRKVITYPEGGGLYKPNQLVTYLGLRKDRAILSNKEGDWKVKVR